VGAVRRQQTDEPEFPVCHSAVERATSARRLDTATETYRSRSLGNDYFPTAIGLSVDVSIVRLPCGAMAAALLGGKGWSRMKKFLRLPDVRSRVALSRSQIYRQMKAGLFPCSYDLGARAVAWLESDIDAWIESRVKGNDDAAENWPIGGGPVAAENAQGTTATIPARRSVQ
jgi:prophage regulatory protein